MITPLRFCAALSVISINLLTGCVGNLYTNNYRDVKATIAPNMQGCVRTPTNPPQLIQVDDINSMGASYVKRGYVTLGYSNFTWNYLFKSVVLLEMKHQTEKVGAEIALYSITPGGVMQGVAAIPTYQPGVNIMANTTGNSSVIGGGGPYYGSYGQTTVITSPGTFGTQYVPTATQLYNYSAVFLALKKPEFLTPQQRALGQ